MLQRNIDKLFYSLFPTVVSLLLMSAFGCTSDNGAPVGNAVYYWRTTLRLSAAERDFLKRENTKTVYLRLFDVVDESDRPEPEASLLFGDTLPSEVRVVPTVFIAPDVLRHAEPDTLADMIVRRVDKMLLSNRFPAADELQLDFDWTLSNREAYFRLLRRAGSIMHERGGKLSVTVRLHQLRQPAPPADYGVLMVYNTGRITDPGEPNSILSPDAVRPYMKDLSRYKLPLITALPLYSWNIVFSGGKFRAIAHSLDVADTTMFQPIDSTHFRCIKYGPLAMAGRRDGSGGRIYPGDVVRHEYVSPRTLTTVLAMLRDACPEATRGIVFYHLDKELLKYDTEFLQKIGSGR